MAAEQPSLTFAGLLRRLRTDAQLTQEDLAKAARLSPRPVSDLERGINRTAHKETALLLADALRLSGRRRELFLAAAQGKAPVPRPNNLPAELTPFIGREREASEIRTPRYCESADLDSAAVAPKRAGANVRLSPSSAG
jgi:transcriptional regulator with XRE-family HTH domain